MMNRLLGVVGSTLLVAAIVSAQPATAQAGQWQLRAGYWHYQDDEGNWYYHDGQNYYWWNGDQWEFHSEAPVENSDRYATGFEEMPYDGGYAYPSYDYGYSGGYYPYGYDYYPYGHGYYGHGYRSWRPGIVFRFGDRDGRGHDGRGWSGGWGGGFRGGYGSGFGGGRGFGGGWGGGRGR